MQAYLKGTTSAAPAAAPPKAKAQDKPWVEKYRPKSVREVECQEEVVAVLTSTLAGNDMPHMLLYGPPGTGKTSTIMAIARQLYGPELIKSRVLELNASDERGISVIREKVKTFAQLTANAVSADSSYPCPPYKIIVLDEADAMTIDAQSALRRTMEQYSKITRFCLICNYVSRIIEPLASRCAKFRFKSLPLEAQLHRLKQIREAEGVNVDDATLDVLVTLSGGDMRQAITILQSAHRLKMGSPITADQLYSITGVLPTDAVTHLVEEIFSRSFERIQAAIDALMASGFTASQLLSQLHDVLVVHPAIDDVSKAKIVERIAQADKALIDGADEELQLLAVTTFAMDALMKAA